MLTTLLGIVTLVRRGQSENAPCPMVVTLLGMVRLVKRVFSNAQSPMVVRLVGRVTLDRLVTFWNAAVPMLVTGKPSIVLGMVTAPPEPVYPVIVIVLLMVM